MALAISMQKAASGRHALQRRLSVEVDKENGSRNALPEAEPKLKPSPEMCEGSSQPQRSVKDSFNCDDFESTSRQARILGEGLFGKVFLVRTKAEKKLVALKMMEKSTLEAQNVVTQLQREIEIHSRLRHPNIVRMYSYFHDARRVYLVLEYCSEGTLFDKLRTAPNKRFDEFSASSTMRQLCSALSYCHRFQIVHRDIKPENILIGKKGQIKLADFGWAVANQSHEENISLKTMCGTVDYIAPEMIQGCSYDERVDAWMVGILLFEMLVGCCPFSCADELDTFDKIAESDVVIPSFVSSSAADLVKGLLTKSPDQRKSVEDVASHVWIREHEREDLV